MTQITISDPSEQDSEAGYYRIQLCEHGALLADIDLAEDAIPDLEEPEDLAQLGEEIQQTAEQLGDIDG